MLSNLSDNAWKKILIEAIVTKVPWFTSSNKKYQ